MADASVQDEDRSFPAHIACLESAAHVRSCTVRHNFTRGTKTEAFRVTVVITDDHSSDLTPKSPAATTEPPAETLEFEVVSPEPELGPFEIATPEGPPTPPVIGKDTDEKFRRLDQIVRRGLATFIEVGHALAEIRDGQLWLAGGYASWAAYCQMVGGLSKPTPTA